MDETNITEIETRYKAGKRYFESALKKNKIFNCSPGFVSGHCKGGHSFASVQFCGREYCPDCRRDGSPIHQKRVSRVWAVAKDWQKMGYLVVTIPDYLRPYFKNKELLRDFRFKLLRKLKESYNIREGVARWHWFGDCDSCNGLGCTFCDDTGAGNFWHPHLNILFPVSDGNKENIKDFLAPLRSWMRLYYKKIIEKEINTIKVGNKVLFLTDEDETKLNYLLEIYADLKKVNFVINYSYVTEEKYKMNRVKYVFRSTFRRYDKEVHFLLYNFRNSIQWGWKKSAADIDDNAPEPIYCPECEKVGVKHIIKWGGIEKHNKKNIIEIIKNKTDEPTNENPTIKRKPTIYRMYRGI